GDPVDGQQPGRLRGEDLLVVRVLDWRYPRSPGDRVDLPAAAVEVAGGGGGGGHVDAGAEVVELVVGEVGRARAREVRRRPDCPIADVVDVERELGGATGAGGPTPQS